MVPMPQKLWGGELRGGELTLSALLLLACLRLVFP
jgi:hypothetical protein